MLHAVNSGNGTLYNVRIPIELGSLINNTASLTFLEAHVVAVSGTTSAAVDLDNPITPVAYGDGAGYAHGHRKVTLGIDSMAPSSIVTIRLRLRMVLCTDLSLRIVRAHWGCAAGLAGSCLTNLDVPELNSYMEIKSGSARVDVVEHLPTPVLDLCGSTVRIAISSQFGSVNVYEPVIRERRRKVQSSGRRRYSINGGLTLSPNSLGSGLHFEPDHEHHSWHRRLPDHLLISVPDNDGKGDKCCQGSFSDPVPGPVV